LFYIILKGKVSIFIENTINISLTEEEYYIHLLKLKKYNERFFYNKTIEANKLTFVVDGGNIEKNANDYMERLKNKFSLFPVEQEIIKEMTKLIKDCEEINYKEIIEYPIRIDNDFIHSSHPRIIPNLKSKKYDFKIPTYVNVVSLNKGEYFGEVALENKNSKRMATVIVDEDTDFGLLDKVSFDLCIKELHENIKKANVSFMMSSQLFNFFTKSYFEKHFYNSFKLHDIERTQKIVSEGDVANQLYIIKEGEFNVTFNRSIVELNELIIHFGGKNPYEEDEMERMASESTFNNFMKLKRNVNISIQQPRDIVGLDDFIYKNKYALTIECKTSKAQYWEIKKYVSFYN